uniref:(northern house mosquito) hypothetical protein n=1 Tax=Culex pipiens TaxID=7175 RepID=A0A8D8HS56_CULPI
MKIPLSTSEKNQKRKKKPSTLELFLSITRTGHHFTYNLIFSFLNTSSCASTVRHFPDRRVTHTLPVDLRTDFPGLLEANFPVEIRRNSPTRDDDRPMKNSN